MTQRLGFPSNDVPIVALHPSWCVLVTEGPEGCRAFVMVQGVAVPGAKKSSRYKVLAGLDYISGGKYRRVEAGEVADDIPGESVGWLREQGLIEDTDEDATPVTEGEQAPEDSSVEPAVPAPGNASTPLGEGDHLPVVGEEEQPPPVILDAEAEELVIETHPAETPEA